MTITQIVSEIRAHIEPWAKKNNARLSVARDPWNAYELVASGSRGLILVIGFAGERAVDGPRHNPLATARIEVTLGSGMGLTAEPDANTFRDIGDRAALSDLLDDLIKTLSSLTFSNASTSSKILEYQGTEPLTLSTGMRLAAFVAAFAVTRIVLSTPQTP